MADDSDVNVRFGSAVEGLLAGANQVKASIDSIKENVASLNESFVRLAEVAGISLSIAGIKSFIESMAELGEKTVAKADELGVPAEKVGELSGIAKLTGTSIDVLAHSFERMTLMVQRSASSAFSPAAEGLRVLGINAKDLIGLPTDKYFEKLADAVSKFNPSMNLTNALTAVGGRGITALIPALMKGAEGFRELESAVDATGAKLSDVQARAFSETSDKISTLSLSFQGLGIKIFEVIKPAVDAVTDAISRWLQSIKEDDIRDAINVVGVTVINFGRSASLVFVNVKESFDRLTQGVQEKIKVFTDIGNIFSKLLTLSATFSRDPDVYTDSAKAAAAAVAVVGTQADESRTKINAFFDDIAGRFATAVPKSGSFEAAAADAKNLAEEIDIIATKYAKLNAAQLQTRSPADREQYQNAVKAAQEAYSVETKLADDQFSQTKEHLSAELRQHQVTYDQETASLLAALDRQSSAQESALAKQAAAQFDASTKYLATLPQESAEWKKALDDRAQAWQKYQDKLVEAASKSATQRRKIEDDLTSHDVDAWKNAADQISGAFNSQIQKMLAGTENFATAMKAISSQLLIKLIQDQIKLTAEFLAQQAQQLAAAVAAQLGITAATTTGAALRTAANVASGETSILAGIASALKSIFTSAGVTSAEVAAAVAPVAGPAAPGIGAAAGAATIGVATALVGSAEVGAHIVSGGLVNVHSGEDIVPAKMNQPYAGAGAGGGAPTIHINGPVIGNQAWINSMIPQLSRALSNYGRYNPSAAGA